jgi:hypothetical protein
MTNKTLVVGDVFSVARGVSKYTRGYGVKNPGKHPVYSASVSPLTHINSFDHEGEFLSWATNGYGGTMKVLNGRFSINADRALLIPKIDGLNLDYCRIVLEPLFRERAVGRIVDGKKNEYTKLPPPRVLDVEFEVPVDKKGRLDEKEQARIVQHAQGISALASKARDITKILSTAHPVPSIRQENFVEVPLQGDWIEYVTAKTGWTKTRYRQIDTGNTTDIPVYSAAKQPVAYVSKKYPALIEARADAPIISFASNGDGSAGTNFVFHVSPFYVSNDRTCLRIIDKLIEPEFVYFSLHGMKQTYGFGHSFKANKSNLESVNIGIPVKNGKYDIKQQCEIVARYKKLYAVRDALEAQLETIASAKVSA